MQEKHCVVARETTQWQAEVEKSWTHQGLARSVVLLVYLLCWVLEVPEIAVQTVDVLIDCCSRCCVEKHIHSKD